MNLYNYAAKLIRVIDGDTYELEVDLGFGIKFTERFRLYGADTPEIFGKNASEEGKIASDVVNRILVHNGPQLKIFTIKDRKGKYGRYLADIFIYFDENGNPTNRNIDEVPMTLSLYLILNGYAKKV